jgi:hypothetical protein
MLGWPGEKVPFFPRAGLRAISHFFFGFLGFPRRTKHHPNSSPPTLACSIVDTLSFMSFISIMNEQVFQAAVEYTAGYQEETHSNFLRRKGMKTKSHQIYFSLFMSASKSEWQQKAKHAREMGTAIAARTPHRRKVMRLALRIFDMRQEEEEKIQKHQQASGKRKTHPTSNEAEGAPDLQELQASVVSMTDAIRSVQRQWKEASKLLAAERQTIRKWKQDKEQLQTPLMEYSESLVERSYPHRSRKNATTEPTIILKRKIKRSGTNCKWLKIAFFKQVRRRLNHSRRNVKFTTKNKRNGPNCNHNWIP